MSKEVVGVLRTVKMCINCNCRVVSRYTGIGLCNKCYAKDWWKRNKDKEEFIPKRASEEPPGYFMSLFPDFTPIYPHEYRSLPRLLTVDPVPEKKD